MLEKLKAHAKALKGAIVAFAHSNTRVGFGPLEHIVVSPNYHRIHHRRGLGLPLRLRLRARSGRGSDRRSGLRR